jgi:hypothetical protein
MQSRPTTEISRFLFLRTSFLSGTLCCKFQVSLATLNSDIYLHSSIIPLYFTNLTATPRRASWQEFWTWVLRPALLLIYLILVESLKLLNLRCLAFLLLYLSLSLFPDSGVCVFLSVCLSIYLSIYLSLYHLSPCTFHFGTVSSSNEIILPMDQWILLHFIVI